MSQNKKLTIGLFGFGVVGEGIYKVLQDTPTLNAEIKKVCIKHPDKKREAPASLFTTNADELLYDQTINVIVELIDDAESAYYIVTTALNNKKSVVSANKKMIAENLEELLLLQKQNDVSFLYEAAVCGSIPVIRNLEEYYDNDLLNSFSGIVNGSTNYILTKMNEEGLSYEKALKQAQELGFAESNPALDVEGKDAVNKLAIVLQHAYGVTVKPTEILHKGITFLHGSDTQYASEKGHNIKLVATAKRIDDTHIVAFVLPTFVNNQSQLYNIRNEFNGVLIGSKLADQQFLYGKGAGRYPTSSAVLSDIAALRYDYRYEYKKAERGIDYQLTKNDYIKVYVSFVKDGEVDKNDFEKIEESYTSYSRKYFVGIISLQKLQDATWFNNKDVSVISFDNAEVSEPIFTVEELSVFN
ncbi:MAG: homoserine dehydrogenase [Bacteroidota bacterium]|nr:homoserine dehydrogenase [Bacteroidota bacterium]